jgi:hypothetical protein
MNEPSSLSSIAFNTGVIAERSRLVKQLFELGVLRHSMLGDNWYVIYTEQGPMDITKSILEGNG